MGRVRYAGWVSGYGGVIVLEHKIGGQTTQSLYGHLRLVSTKLKVGDRVSAGQFLANLGADKSKETDGERKHLHFSLRAGRTLSLRGYVSNMKDVSGWLNPQDFFAAQGIDMKTASRNFDPTSDRGGNEFLLTFVIPSGWGVEFIPQIHALNLFALSGSGSARGRSQILILNVAAKSTAALKGFKVGASEAVNIGAGIAAVRSEVGKKWTTSTYLQPTWRASRHTVWVLDGTDANHSSVIAVNPKLPQSELNAVLSSLSR